MLSPLTTSPDHQSFLVDSIPWTWRGSFVWPLYGQYLTPGEGAPHVRSILQDRRSVGANTITLGGMWSRTPNLHPVIPGYWEGLRDFCQIALDEDMRLNWIVFASTKPGLEWLGMPPGSDWPGFPGFANQLAHWERFYVTLADFPNVSYVLANQPGHPDQPTPTPNELKTFTIPVVGDFPPQLVARNNPFEDRNPILPPLDYSCYCSSRRFPKGMAELGFSMWNIVHGNESGSWTGTNQVSINLEPPRISEDPSNSGFQWASPWRWRQIARTLCFSGTGGGNIYSDQDRFGEIYSGITRDCAVEFLGNLPQP